MSKTTVENIETLIENERIYIFTKLLMESNVHKYQLINDLVV